MNLKSILTIIAILFFPILIGTCCITKLVATKPLIEFSKGERIGVLRKLSKKGWYYKTYEGELMLNAGLGSVKLDTFNFSVQDQTVADSLLANLGQNLKLTYTEYKLMPYKVGNTNYLITSFKKSE